jgi:hypothetical protein
LAGRTTVVSYSDDGCEVGDVAGNLGWPVGKGDVTPETAEQCGEASAAADGYDPERGSGGGVFERLSAWLRGARNRWSELG